jgi:mannose-6-phosphate isomerase-like protein (cupin superfamily)
MSYIGNIVGQTKENTFFRKVIFTGRKSQLVVMDIPPGGEIGMERHDNVEQTLFFLSGQGEAILDGKKHRIGGGFVVVVTPGTEHNFINTGSDPLKVYTLYAPANHIDGRVHKTKTEADADDEDEKFGHGVQ